MLDPGTQTAQTTPPATGNGTGAGADAGQDAMSTEAFINELVGMRGTAPGVAEGMDETQQLILENQFKQDTRALVADIKEAIQEVSPDIGRGDLQEFARAFVQGDPLAMWKVAQSAARKAAEKEDNEKEQEDLRVEGSNSGTKGTEKEPITTTSQAALALAEALSA